MKELSMRPHPLHTPLLDCEYGLDHSNKQKEEKAEKDCGANMREDVHRISDEGSSFLFNDSEELNPHE